ncbi:MAG: exodeoxyribonuclease VII small subunit [Bdellovibrionota bacterium]
MTLQNLLDAKDFEAQIKQLNYEDGLALVEALLNSVESGELALEQSITSYEKGMALVKHLRGLLAGAEERLKVLKDSEDGIKIEDFE